MNSNNNETFFEFPCVFPLKVMGLSNENFESEIVTITRKHISDWADATVQSKPSKNGKYTAVTLTFTAQSKTQLDDLYREINTHPNVKMVL